MLSRKKIVLVTSVSIVNLNIVFAAGWKEDSKAIDISGGEDHTLVLTANKRSWACGANGGSGYAGVLGTGSGSSDLIQKWLVRVHDGDMNTPSDYLEDITDVDAGWKQSLALESYDPGDPNRMGYVWSWGSNYWGQLGVGEATGERSTPIQVLRGAQAPADPNNPDPNLARIVDISAGRSGEHSLAVDVNGYVYAWGRNQEGQCGNGGSGYGLKELVPVYVLRGEQDPENPYNPNLNLTRIVAVSAGEQHSMALEKDDPNDANSNGCVYTWGSNIFGWDGDGRGVLGNGSNEETSPTPVRVLAGQQDLNEPNQLYLKHIVAISAGWDHSMALERDNPWDPNLNGRVYTWGRNGQGYGGGCGSAVCQYGRRGRVGNGKNSEKILADA